MSSLRKPALVAGIILEYTPIEVALQTLCMSRGELEKVLSTSPEWPFPASLDGWKLSHDAIRFDMEAIQTAIDTTKSQVYDGNALVKWQIDAFRLAIGEFCRTVYKHQEHEEELLFPWLAQRVRLPSKLSADRRATAGLLGRVKAMCDELRPAEAGAAKASLDRLSSSFSQLRTLMRQHLEEEEIVGLPLLRKYFTAREAEAVERRILADMKPTDLAWFLRPMDPLDKKEALRRLRVPALVQRLAVLPAVRRDERTVLRAYRDLAAGEQRGSSGGGGGGAGGAYGGQRRLSGMMACLSA